MYVSGGAHMPRCASGGQLSGVRSFLPRIEFRPTGFSCKDFYLLSHLAGPRQFYLFFSNLFTVLLLQWLEPRRECCIKIAKVWTAFYPCLEEKHLVQHRVQNMLQLCQGPFSQVLSCLLACSVILNG